jgi:hypothetical protein
MLMGKSDSKKSLRRLRRRWVINMKMALKKTECKLDSSGSNYSMTLLNTVKNVSVPHKAEGFVFNILISGEEYKL